MTATSPSAFLLSATLHGVVIALALLLNYAATHGQKDEPKILVLVAGEGDDFMATEAPALGTETGVKIAIANRPEPTPTPPPPQPAPPVVTSPPPTPAPTPAVKPPPPETTPNFAKELKDDLRAADRKVKRELAKKRAEEEKQRQAEKKRQEEQDRRLTKKEYDEKYGKTKTVASATSAKTPNVKRIDVKGITGGVVGGSSASKKGAGGKALTSDNTDVMAAYYAYFKQELRRRFEPPPGLADTLEVDIEARNNPDGTFTNVRVSKSSGSKEFDQAVLEAVRRVKLPPRPDKKAESVEFSFAMRERGEG